ncbi:MAG: hypothetical protein RLZZ265_396 [Verrucomicrobiota bacterium]|jgi:O-methyltransferase
MFSRLGKRSRRQWLEEEYTPFGYGQKRQIMMSIARFCQINRPIGGYYFEFGCHGANTMRMAWDCFHHLFDWSYVGFDSFEGLPEIQAIDQMKIWEKGKLKTTEEEFRRVVTRHGMPDEKLTTVKGFYDQTLTPALRNRFLPGGKVAVAYVDCDLYASTIPILEFLKDFLQTGTVIVFDDWNCFYGDPERGERRAWREFCQRNPHLRFEEFVRTSEGMSFIHLGPPPQP